MQREEAGGGRRTKDAVRTVDEPTQPTADPATAGREATQRVLDRYRLVRRLGAGGFGVVWLAEDERLGRAVAVKRIVMHHAGVAARAEREARAAARLAHPGIVALYESGRDADAVYLVSELVRGRTLADLMDAGELSDRDVLRVGAGLCDALAHAHSRGVIHRDVKPGNVIVPDGWTGEGHAGVAKLTDFGIARMLGDDALTATGDVVGTLAYMAPEQAEGAEVGAEADLYALALVLYEALSGVNPVRGRGAAATARRVGARLPALGRLRRDLPLELCRALDRAVLPRPEQRGTLGELRDALAGALPQADDEQGTIAASPLEGLASLGAGPAPRPRVRPRARVVAALAAAGLVAAALAWLTPGAGVVVSPATGAAAAALAVLLLPRVGWAAMAAALVVWAGGATGAAIALAAAPTMLLLRRAGPLWSLPAGAPLLGLAGLAGAWPALAAQAARPWHRAALGALGGWWLALAEVLTGDRLALGVPPGASLDGAHLMPLVTSGALALAGLWAAAAVLLPVLVRGRAFAADAVGASAWAAGLGSATQAVAGTLSWQPTMRGLVAGAVVSGGLAVALAASRGSAYVRSAS
ncbi:MAG: eukaryotic-like serine/threonine-protein kinase [Solirubrobacteraceae bacterium]|nr:eukaryotic-like serine/threonine-protein kinase [Solirubrobacteraceae bacterium]